MQQEVARCKKGKDKRGAAEASQKATDFESRRVFLCMQPFMFLFGPVAGQGLGDVLVQTPASYPASSRLVCMYLSYHACHS